MSHGEKNNMTLGIKQNPPREGTFCKTLHKKAFLLRAAASTVSKLDRKSKVLMIYKDQNETHSNVEIQKCL